MEGHWRLGKNTKNANITNWYSTIDAALGLPTSNVHTHFGRGSKQQRAVSTHRLCGLSSMSCSGQRSSLLPFHCISSLKRERAKTSLYCRFESCRQFAWSSAHFYALRFRGLILSDLRSIFRLSSTQQWLPKKTP